MQTDHRSGRTILAILVLPVLTVAFLWIPFGFSLGGLVEEWGFLELFARKGVFYIITDATLQAQKARPLHVLPQALAYTLDPDSFLFWHIIQAAALTVKAGSAAVIGLYLTGNRALAAFLGLLTLLYPADTMQLNFRALSDNCAVALALLATALVVSASRVESRWLRVVVGAVASAILGAGLLMWEAVAGLAALPLLLVFAREGKGAIQVFRKRPDICLIWLSAIAGWFVFFVSAVRAGSGYQVSVLSGVSLDALPKLLGGLVSSGAYRAFYECWVELADIVLNHLGNFVYPLSFTGIVLIALVWLAKEAPDGAMNATRQVAARIVVAGLFAFAFGYAPFLASNAHLSITQRTFLTAAMGGALVLFGVVVYMFTVLDKRVVAGASALLVGGCMVAQLYQFDKYNRIYASVYRPILSAVMPFIWDSADRSNSVLFNDYGYLSVVWDFGLELKPAIGYLLPGIEPKSVFICESRSGRLLPRWLGEPERLYCKRTGDSIVITKDGRMITELKGAAIGRLGLDGGVFVESSESEPNWRPLPSRVVRMLAAAKWRPTDSMFRRSEHADRYECRFEYMWGYAVPCRTFGFFEPQPLHAALDSSYASIGEANAGLIFDIEPSQANYQLVIEIQSVVSSSHAVEVTLNGTKLSGQWRDPTRFEAIFSGKLLRSANNVLELGAQLNHNLGLSMAVRAVSVAPQGRPNSNAGVM